MSNIEKEPILYLGDNRDILDEIIESESYVDSIITSPPYDNMRDYNNTSSWNFEIFKEIANRLFKVLKPGGIMVWIVNDKYIKGQRSGSTAKQQLYFQEIGFLLHDIMIWEKPSFAMPSNNRFHQVYEFMLVLKKPGDKHTFNQIKDVPVKYTNAWGKNAIRQKDGTMKEMTHERNYNKLGGRTNVWKKNTSGHENPCKKIEHPATFPVGLIKDLLIAWTNKDDIVLDPFMGSATTGVACKELDRKFVGIEIDKNYFEISVKRLAGKTNE